MPPSQTKRPSCSKSEQSRSRYIRDEELGDQRLSDETRDDESVDAEQTEAHEHSAADDGAEVKEPSVFDLFEPPPDIDPNRFGPIPIVPDVDERPPASTASLTGSILMGEPGLPDIEPLPQMQELADFDSDQPVVAPNDFVDLAPTESAASLGFDEAPQIPERDFDPARRNRFEYDDDVPAESEAGALLNDFFGDEAAIAKPVSSPEVADVEAPADLPHWSEPATGQVPSVVGGEREDDVWTDLSGPRWHGEGPEWAGDDIADVFGFTPVEEGVEPESDDVETEAPGAGSPQRAPIPRQRPSAQPATPDNGGRNIPQALLVGGLVAGLALAAFYFGKASTVALITAIAVLGGLELFNKMREVGVHPATLLGTVACGAMPLAVYHRGPAGFMMVGALGIVFGALWYIVGADTHRPALNMGLTMLGVMWVGGLSSFAALTVQLDDGISLLLVGVVATVVFDTGAYAGGRAIGKTPFHSASPNKTWEGTLVGVACALASTWVLALLEVSAFHVEITDALIVGAVCGILAPLGDLTESIIKRDLGVKDMGTLLPGHGGVLDRVDGLLFVMPGIYYLALLLL